MDISSFASDFEVSADDLDGNNGRRTAQPGETLPILLRLALLVLVGLPAPLLAAEPAVRHDPAPDWVTPRPIPPGDDPPEDQLRDGVYILLFDRQIRVHPTTVERFERLVQRVVSQPGIETASQIRIEFDPTYEELSLHSVRLTRGGETHEVLRPSDVNVIQREEDLEYGIFDGTHTAVLFLEDVRVGDVIDYSFSVDGQNPVFGGRFLDWFWTAGSHPYRAIRFRLLWPTSRKLHVRSHGSDAVPAIRNAGDLDEYLWSFENTKAIIPDSDLPDWFYWYPWVELSEFESWAEVARWGASLFSPPEALPPTVQSVVDEIGRRRSTEEERLLAALRFVQDEIRYLGIEIGPNSHRPHDPETVLRRRFGDCKDKALLLLSMLRELGIEADAALVDTDLLTHVEELHPSPYAFNHAIVRARIGDRILWLDPTESYQRGGLDQLSWDVPSKALTLRNDVTSLESIPENRATTPDTRVEYEIASESFDSPTSLAITTIYEGKAANRQRPYLMSESREELQTDYLDFYAAKYPFIETTRDIVIEDDPRKNVVRVEESYSIDDFWEADDEGRRTARFYPMEIRSLISLPDSRNRTMPIRWDHPEHRSLRIRARLPAEFAKKHRSEVIEDSAFRLEYRRKQEGRSLELFYDYQSLQDHVAPDAAEAHFEHIEDAWDLLRYRMSMNPSGSPWLSHRLLSLGILSILWLGYGAPLLLVFFARRRYLAGQPAMAARLAALAHGLSWVNPRPRLARAGTAVALGQFRSSVGQHDEAQRLLESALRRSVTWGRRANRIHAAALLGLAILRIRQERFRDAKDYLARADEAEKALGRIRPVVRAHRALLRASVDACLGDVAGASEVVDEAERLGRGDRLVSYVANSVRAEILEAEGDVSGARERYERNLSHAREIFGPNHFFTGEAAKAVAEFESRQGDRARSAEFRKQALDILSRHYSENSPDLASLGAGLPSRAG